MKRFVAAVSVVGSMAVAANACDLCAVYTSTEAKTTKRGAYLGVSEQFTRFGTLQEDGEEVNNKPDQYLESSITQMLLGYRFHERFGLQVNIPYIFRSYRTVEPEPPASFLVKHGTVNGLGDVSVVADARVFERIASDWMVFWNVVAGVKFPTGDPDQLKHAAHHAVVPGAPEEGVHPHDLALGSGSFDGIIGTSVLVNWKRVFFSAATQYAIRSQGSFGYEYADDLTWNGGPGVYVLLKHGTTISLQCNVSGETKGEDTVKGHASDDTAATFVYLGPELALTWKEKLSADIGVDIPVVRDNSGVQVVPDYRLRAGIVWRF